MSGPQDYIDIANIRKYADQADYHGGTLNEITDLVGQYNTYVDQYNAAYNSNVAASNKKAQLEPLKAAYDACSDDACRDAVNAQAHAIDARIPDSESIASVITECDATIASTSATMSTLETTLSELDTQIYKYFGNIQQLAKGTETEVAAEDLMALWRKARERYLEMLRTIDRAEESASIDTCSQLQADQRTSIDEQLRKMGDLQSQALKALKYQDVVNSGIANLPGDDTRLITTAQTSTTGQALTEHEQHVETVLNMPKLSTTPDWTVENTPKTETPSTPEETLDSTPDVGVKTPQQQQLTTPKNDNGRVNNPPTRAS